ncbi:MAG TPA: GH1 family beta-glucosidase [Candidatus Limnocylindrales bacterium]|jgi:beta-glucosidase|nr:GH1 family beta-glucosidase [Candidatus Limnocylindrales bacterium]
MRFPDGFLWGVATAAYQIEGAVQEGGRGESIWDRFSHTPGRTRNGEDGDVACDHYHRWSEDVDLMASLGIPAYRFSVAWPRVQPSGSGPANGQGIDFYARLVDGLLARGIAPVATLYHWDLPQALQDRGGWPSRDTVGRYVDYAAIVYRALGDRVRLWVTHNEPWVAAFLGHEIGIHAPGLTDRSAALRAGHHLLLSHGRTLEAYRAEGLSAPIGITLNLWPVEPASDRDEDVEATRTADGYNIRWFLDPLFGRDYPADMVDRFAALGHPLDAVQGTDMAAIAAPLDFLGVNYYSRSQVRADPSRPLGYTIVDPAERGLPTTAMGWLIDPPGLRDLLVRVRDEYSSADGREVPLYITENGAAFEESAAPGDAVQDDGRIDYLRSHIEAAGEAISAGVPLRGYFVWSLLDNFEWAEGYRPRFGIVRVDYPTQRRTPKASADFYRRVVEVNGTD